jgi:hypothetical protein
MCLGKNQHLSIPPPTLGLHGIHFSIQPPTNPTYTLSDA